MPTLNQIYRYNGSSWDLVKDFSLDEQRVLTTGNIFKYRSVESILQSLHFNNVVGSIQEIRGNSIAYNQLVPNPTFDGTGRWAPTSVSFSVSNNTGIFTATAQYGSIQATSINFIKGHKYLLSCFHKGTTGGFNVYSSGDGQYFALGLSNITDSSFVQRTIIIEYNTGTGGTRNLIFQDNRASGWTEQQFKEIYLVDLTQWFGSNDAIPADLLADPSLFTKKYWKGSLPANTGTMKNFIGDSVESVGINRFNINAPRGETYAAATIRGTEISITGTYYCSWDINLEAGKTYYVKYTVVSGNSNNMYIRLHFIDGTISDSVYRDGNRFTASKDVDKVYLYCASGTSATVVYDEVCINISDSSINGNYYPFVETVNKVVDYSYKFGINLWDETSYILGESISTSGGGTYINANAIATKYIDVLPNTRLYAYVNSGDTQMYVAYYDKNHTFISGGGWNRNSFKDTPNNAYYMRFSVQNYGTVYKHDICINISDSNINGKYYPHSLGTMFYNGLCKAGSAKDKLTQYKATKNVGSVKLKDLTWVLRSGKTNTFQVAYTPIKATTGDGQIANVFSAKYIATNVNTVLADTQDKVIAINTNSNILIRDTGYTDATTFKNHFTDDDVLNFELATPIEMDLVKYSRLPSDYQEVDYIQSSGTQYIDTGYKPSEKDSFEFAFNENDLTTDQNIFGARTSATSNNLTVKYENDNVIEADYGNYNTNRKRITLNNTNKNVFKLESNSKIIFNGTSHSLTAVTFQLEYNALIFDIGGNPYDTNKFKGKLYYFKIWNGGTLVRDYVPCYRKSDGTIGLYDLVNHKFYTNKGTGTFTKGPDSSSPTVSPSMIFKSNKFGTEEILPEDSAPIDCDIDYSTSVDAYNSYKSNYSNYVGDETNNYSYDDIKQIENNQGNYLPLSGGTLAGSETIYVNTPAALTIKRNNSSDGIYIDYKNKNQDTNYWRVGMYTDDRFAWLYNANIILTMSISGNLELINGAGIKGRDSSSSVRNLIQSTSNDYIYLGGSGWNGIYSYNRIIPGITNNYALGTSSLQWSAIYGNTIYENGTSLVDKYLQKAQGLEPTFKSSEEGSAYLGWYKIMTLEHSGWSWANIVFLVQKGYGEYASALCNVMVYGNASGFTSMEFDIMSISHKASLEDRIAYISTLDTNNNVKKVDIYVQRDSYAKLYSIIISNKISPADMLTLYTTGSPETITPTGYFTLNNSGFLPVSGGTLANTNVDILTIKRTSSNSGAFIDYKNNNQNTNYWRVGMAASNTYSWIYNGNQVFQLDTTGNILLINNTGIKGFDSGGNSRNLLKITSGNNIDFGNTNLSDIYLYNRLVPGTTDTYNLGTSNYQFNNIYGKTIYENGSSLSSKYLSKSGGSIESGSDYIQINPDYIELGCQYGIASLWVGEIDDGLHQGRLVWVTDCDGFYVEGDIYEDGLPLDEKYQKIKTTTVVYNTETQIGNMGTAGTTLSKTITLTSSVQAGDKLRVYLAGGTSSSSYAYCNSGIIEFELYSPKTSQLGGTGTVMVYAASHGIVSAYIASSSSATTTNLYINVYVLTNSQYASASYLYVTKVERIR